jgi:signal transduction histidine kinase
MEFSDQNNITATMPCARLLILIFAVVTSFPALAQKKQLAQVKTFDQQLVPFRNVEISINGKDYIKVGNKGEAFVELDDTDLPLKSIKIKDDKLETASWNYSKGIIEVIIRTKSYHIVQVFVKSQSHAAIPNLAVTFKGKKETVATTNGEGMFEIPLALDEKINAADQFNFRDYNPVKFQQIDGKNVLTVDKIQIAKPVVENAKPYFSDFDFSKLDSIQSLTVFYAIFKNYQIKDMTEQQKQRVDAKFNQLVQKLQDSVQPKETPFIGKISDSSFVSDDIKNLLSQATMENHTLEGQRSDFDQKIGIIQEKLQSGMQNLDASTRTALLSDLAKLEGILVQNEGKFYKNQNDYRDIINSLKENFLDVEDLEHRLSESESQRMEEQRIFRQKLFATLAVAFVFAILLLLLVHFSTRLKKQKHELVRVNAEIKRINENLEGLVAERTKLLAGAVKELDTFLYRASHDLRSPVCSIIGLCNIALMLAKGESKELVERMVNTTSTMDRLLKKLSLISEINQPSNFSSITMIDTVEKIKANFDDEIADNHVKFTIDCPADIVIYSYPNLIEIILSNLVENALFYSVLKNPDNAEVRLATTIKNGQLEISLYDNGIGMDGSVLERVFDMFFKGSENSKGSGLGLYIVQKSVQALEGTITTESELGRFSRFNVYLPLKAIDFGAPKVLTEPSEVPALQ